MLDKEVYYKEVLSQMPRILNLLDRNPASKTFGSFDREFWNYNAFDFSCARKQEAVLTLALMYNLRRKDNIYYNSPLLLEWINAALNYWVTIQHKNGSFDEIYPNENAFNTTAFSAYCVSETLLLLKNKIFYKEEILSALKKAGNFLLKKHERRVFNQQAGAAICLYNIYLLTKNKKYKLSSQKKIKFILSNQTKEGWFREYRGADIGYLSLCLDYLAKYYSKTKDPNLLKALKRVVEFISYFVHPDSTFGGEYGSRNTEYMIPHGFEILSGYVPAAGAIASSIREAISKKTSVVPSTIDDKYLLFNTYTYLQAYYDAASKNNCRLPYKKNFKKVFDEAGLYIVSDKNFYLISNLRKGGALKIIFKKNLKSLDDAGITLKCSDGKKYTSSWLSDKPDFKISKGGFEVYGNMYEFYDNILNSLKFIALRGFQLTFGRSEKISLKVKNILRDKTISKSKVSQFNFERELKISKDKICIIDKTIIKPKAKELIISSKMSFIYGASSRYFQKSDLNSKFFRLNKLRLGKFRFAREYNLLGKVTIKKN